MIFQTLILQNFGPYYGRHTLDLSTTQNSPIILIGGLNGGGKTTIMDAIRLALYGQRAQCDRRRTLAYGDFLTQCVNAKASSNDITQIELTLHHVIRLSGIDKHATLCITRSWTRHPKNGRDQFEVELDGWPDITLTQTWDEQIEDWFPLGLSNLFLFDGEQVKELAEQVTPPPTVVNAIRSVLGLELADRLATDLTVLVSRKRAEYADSDEQQHVETLVHQLRQTEQDLEQEAETQKQISQDIESAQAAVAHAQERFFAKGGHITEQSAALLAQTRHLNAELQLQLQALRDLAASTLPLAMVQPLLDTAAAQGQQEQNQQKAAIARDLVLDHDQRLLDLLNQLKLHHTQRRKIQTFLQQETDSLQHTADDVKAWLNITDDQLSQLNHLLQTQLSNEQQLAQDHLTQTQRFTAELDALDHKLAKAASPEDYERLKSNQEKAQLHLSELTLTLEIHKRRSNELERRKHSLHKELEQTSERAIADGNTNALLSSGCEKDSGSLSRSPDPAQTQRPRTAHHPIFFDAVAQVFFSASYFGQSRDVSTRPLWH